MRESGHRKPIAANACAYLGQRSGAHICRIQRVNLSRLKPRHSRTAATSQAAFASESVHRRFAETIDGYGMGCASDTAGTRAL